MLLGFSIVVAVIGLNLVDKDKPIGYVLAVVGTLTALYIVLQYALS